MRASRTERSPVVIAGGGVAGLAAAWRLRRAGFRDHVVLDLGDAAGGTARGGRTGAHAYPWGAHYLPTPLARQRGLVAFLRDAGIVDRIDEGGRAVAAMRHRVRAPQERVCQWGYWREGLWPADGQSADDVAQYERFREIVRSYVPTDDERAFDLPLDRSSAAARELDRIDAATWAAAEGLVGERIRWYLEYATRDDFGATLEQTSAWALLHYFCCRLSTGGDSGEYLTWPSGNQFLIDRLLDDSAAAPRTGQLALDVRPDTPRVEVLDVRSGARYAIDSEQVIVAAPQFVVGRLLAEDPAAESRARFRYGSWVVANVHLRDVPPSRGFGLCWDNVIYGSDSLGYVDAGHQVDRLGRDRVWTWYLPLVGDDEASIRADLERARWPQWRDRVLADLRRGHPDVESYVERIDVWRWGHAMVKPYPGFLFGGDRDAARAPFGGLHFAHSDVGGLPLFEEAFAAGVRAAEEVLGARGIPFEPLG